MDLPQLIGILGTARDRCGLAALLTLEPNQQLLLCVQEPNGYVRRPFSREEFSEAVSVEGGSLPIDPPILLPSLNIRGGWFGRSLLEASEVWQISLPVALRKPLRAFPNGIFWLEDLELISRTFNEWANLAAAALIFGKGRLGTRLPMLFPRLFPALPAAFAVMFTRAPNDEHRWVVVQRYIRQMSPPGHLLDEDDAQRRIQEVLAMLHEVHQRAR
jgi:hypothetical protein